MTVRRHSSRRVLQRRVGKSCNRKIRTLSLCQPNARGSMRSRSTACRAVVA